MVHYSYILASIEMCTSAAEVAGTVTILDVTYAGDTATHIGMGNQTSPSQDNHYANVSVQAQKVPLC